jgi:hypothetical protein
VSRNQRYQSQKVVNPEMRPASCHHLEWGGRCCARPGCRQASQRTGFIDEVDAVLAPCLAPIHQHELAPMQRVEGMSNLEELRLADQIACS